MGFDNERDSFAGHKITARFNASDSVALNHHLGAHEQVVVSSSRWNPTPEQIEMLEELYRRGTRTPSSEQIQHITAQLRRYGKIEGKNVFYWFQNHKARERQKRRRQSDVHFAHEDEKCEKKESLGGANRTVFEVEQTKKLPSPRNFSTTITEKRTSRQESAEAVHEADGWMRKELHADIFRRNANRQMMLVSPPSSSSCSSTPSARIKTMAPRSLLDIYLCKNESRNRVFGQSGGIEDEEYGTAQTLQLFPLQSCRGSCEAEEEDEEESSSQVAKAAANVASYQFFEFLPLKN